MSSLTRIARLVDILWLFALLGAAISYWTRNASILPALGFTAALAVFAVPAVMAHRALGRPAPTDIARARSVNLLTGVMGAGFLVFGLLRSTDSGLRTLATMLPVILVAAINLWALRRLVPNRPPGAQDGGQA